MTGTPPGSGPRPDAPVYDAVVLAGGEGRRLGGSLGGTLKAEVLVGGRPLVDHVLDAVAGARRCVVVGPPELARHGAPTVLEDPPRGGPVAGIDAGLTHLDATPVRADDGTEDGTDENTDERTDDGGAEPPVVVLACDVPRAAEAVPLLLAALASAPDADGAQMVDAHGERQTLVAVYRRAPLRAALASLGEVRGASVRRLVAGLRAVGVADPDGVAQDADTWQDVARLDEEMRSRS